MKNKKLNNERSAQRLRILSWLRANGSITTIEAREKLSVLHPCGRIAEMRRQGWPIITTWVLQHDSLGQPHRVGKYILSASKKENKGGNYD